MDEVRFWSRALPQCEIQNNMNCELGSGQTSLVAYYKFNQNSGATTLTDESGNNNTGTLNNFAFSGTTSNWVYSGAVTTGTTCTALPTPSVAIAASPSGTITAGTSVTFTATPTNGGTTPTYQWKKGNTNVGTGATYTSSSLLNGDVITCILTPSAEICATTPTVASSGITMSVTEPIRYVKTVASGTGDGTSWANASADLQAMINVTGVLQVWVAAGTYKTSSSDRGSYFQLANNVAVYGGFVGIETLLSQRNVAANPTIISGDIGTSGVNTDNNYHLFVIDTKTNTRLDGFTIRDSYNEYGDGAFRILNNSDVDIANCTFTNNSGYNYGHLRGISSTVRLTNCNMTTGSDENIINQDGTFTVTNCTFFNMKRVFLNNGTGSSTFTNCLFYGINAPNSSGGCIRQSSSGNMTLTNCTFTNNKSYFNPAINIDAGKSVTAVNCIFWDNDGGSGIGGEGTLTITYSIVQGGYIGTGNINDNPLFTNTASNDFTLQHCSSAINKGNNAAVSGMTTDLAGNTRTQQTTVDMGVYESNYSVTPCDYTWTGRTSTDWSTASNWTPNNIPTSIDNVVIPTTLNKPMLPANQTIANLTLTGTNKIMLGNSTLCVNAITGGSSSSYVVTDGTGGLIIKALSPSVSTSFPIGASETSYDPLSIQPTNNVDFTAKVKATTVADDFSGSIANFAKTVKRQWDITPSATAGSTLLTLTNGGTAYTVVGTPKVGHYNGTTWSELTATHNNGTWTATTSAFSPFGVGEAGGFVSSVLPVELLTFTGYNKGGVNILNWTTANEVNNKGFQIERLNTVGNVWDILGFVNANCIDKACLVYKYDFTDNTPLSTSYYRLHQLDNDGKETCSKVISISLKGSDKLKVYPNPVSNVLTIETDMKGDYQILNLLGQEVLSGKAAQHIDVSVLPQGTYFLKVGAEQVKFVKQ
jgi:hypothetical protein